MHTVLKGTILAVLVLASASALAATAYVSNEKSNTISIVDLDRLEVTGTVRVGARPRGITLSKDKKLLYICASDDHRVEVLDLEKLEVVRTLPSGPDPELFVLSPDGRRLYVANEDDNMVTVLDVER